MDYLGWGWGYSVIFFKFIWPQNQFFSQHVTYKFSRIHFRKWWFCSVFFILQLLCFIMLVFHLRLLTAAAKLLQSCPTVWPHRRQPTRLPRPWDSPGKNTGVPDVQAGFKRNQRSNCQHLLDHGKSKRVPEKHLLLLYWLCQSLWLYGSQ